MNKKITLATALAGLLVGLLVIAPSYADHTQITISLVSDTEYECAHSGACVSLSEATLDVGGEIIWANDGSDIITLTSGYAGDMYAGEDFGPIKLEPGQTYSRIFEEGGEISFHLVDHPWMTGSITVVSDDHDDSDGHMHATLEAEEPLALSIDVAVENGGGINIHTITQGWRWTPENVNQDHTPSEGHAHVYVDGIKQRMYGPYHHIPGLEAGSHHIRVTLNANTHDEIYANGFPIEAAATIIIPEHGHTDEPTPIDGTAAMSVEIMAHADAKSGYNINVNVTDLVLSGEGTDSSHVEGQGYAILSINGEYHNRLYTDWLNIPALEQGVHTITVTLFANDHSPYHWNGEPIETSIIVEASDHADEDDHYH